MRLVIVDEIVDEVDISIHAPAWGATTERYIFLCRSVNFNPRTRMGCDLRPFVGVAAAAISIHAPAWGATRFPAMLNGWQGFQSTHPHGVRRPARHGCSEGTEISIHAPAWGATR